MGTTHRFSVPQRLLDGRIAHGMTISGGRVVVEVSSSTDTFYIPLPGVQPAADSAQRVLFSEVATRLRNPQ